MACYFRRGKGVRKRRGKRGKQTQRVSGKERGGGERGEARSQEEEGAGKGEGAAERVKIHRLTAKALFRKTDHLPTALETKVCALCLSPFAPSPPADNVNRRIEEVGVSIRSRSGEHLVLSG